jgi:CBS domain-containing protein
MHEPVFTSRLNGRRLLDAEGMTIGRVQDTVILQPTDTQPPRALGFVVGLQRRRIFVSLSRVGEMSVDGIRLAGSSVDLSHFTQRTGETLASALYDKPAGSGVVLDVGIVPARNGRGWEVSVLAIGQRRGLLRNPATVVPWDKHRELFDAGGLGEQIAELRDMHPHDLAGAVDELPAGHRRQLADAMQDEELADLLQEMPEDEQIGFLAGLGAERIADVIQEMEPDDAADLLAEMPADERERLLANMEADKATDLRRLLSYDAATAGGLMTSQPLIVTPDTSVAEVLARMRQPALGVSEATQAYVCEAPMVTPTGRFIGTVGFQRLLREAPATPVGQCVEESVFVRPTVPERAVAARMAAYNLIGIAVCDDADRLVGAITVDDVLDRLLPADWRRQET